ncbi:MAG: 6-carboxytetrahydropterin synthase QueD [Spirochaetota bacterium]
MYYLTVEDHFSSAHQLRGYKGKCENLHGHNFKVQLTVRGIILNDTGLLIDFHDLKAAVKEVMTHIDHKNLNELPEFTKQNPSSENLARFIFENVAERIKDHRHVEVYEATVFESDTSQCSYRGQETS